MVKKQHSTTLHVLMNGRLVGALERRSSGALMFQYDETWLETRGARPLSLSLPLRVAPYEGGVVYNFFDNLLPDSEAIRAKIQARFQVQSSHPFDLLAAVGADCVGAIQLCSSVQQPHRIDITTAQPLSSAEVASLLRDYGRIPLGMLETVHDFRISIAGAQEKTALLWHQGQWCRPTGTTPTSHIFKLPIGFVGHNQLDLSASCENEWLCLEIVKAFGFSVAQAQIQQFEDIKVLVVERFDRRWSQDGRWLMRLPQEDMCQALGVSPNLKYQSDGGPGIADIMQILLGSTQAETDRETFFCLQILFWLLAAIDGHAKNFSISIEPGGRYRLTPCYDVMSAYPLMQGNNIFSHKAKMAMALRGFKQNIYLWSIIQARHFLSMANTINFSAKRAEQLLVTMLEQTESVAERVSKSLPQDFPNTVSQPILQRLTNLAQKQLKTMRSSV